MKTTSKTKITVEDINKQYEAIQQIEQYYRKVENKQKAEWGKEDAAKRKSEKDKELAEQERLQKELLNQIKETQDQGILYLETEIKNRKLKKQDELRFERELAKFRKDIVLLDDKSTYTQRYAAEVEYKAKIKELDELEDQRKKDARIKTLQDQKIEQQIILENQESTIQYIRDARLKQLEAQNKIDLENFKGTENEKLLLLQKYTNDKLKIERDYQAEKQKIVIQEIQFVQQTANAFLNLASLLTKNQEQLKQIQKIQSLVAIAANTATAISNLVAVSFSSSSPDNIMTGGIAAYVKLATGITSTVDTGITYTNVNNAHLARTSTGSFVMLCVAREDVIVGGGSTTRWIPAVAVFTGTASSWVYYDTVHYVGSNIDNLVLTNLIEIISNVYRFGASFSSIFSSGAGNWTAGTAGSYFIYEFTVT